MMWLTTIAAFDRGQGHVFRRGLHPESMISSGTNDWDDDQAVGFLFLWEWQPP